MPVTEGTWLWAYKLDDDTVIRMLQCLSKTELYVVLTILMLLKVVLYVCALPFSILAASPSSAVRESEQRGGGPSSFISIA